MSRVYLIAADKPLPLRSLQREQTRVMERSPRFRDPGLRGRRYDISSLSECSVAEHTYYRQAVDMLGYSMKPWQYELEVTGDQWALEQLTGYLRENLSPGEQAELWSLWVGDSPARLVRCRGSLVDFDMETLNQCLTAERICLTITL